MPRPKKPQHERKKLVNMWLENQLATTLQSIAKSESRTFTNLVEYILRKYAQENRIEIPVPIAEDPGHSSEKPTEPVSHSNQFPTISISDSTAQKEKVEPEISPENGWTETPFD